MNIYEVEYHIVYEDGEYLLKSFVIAETVKEASNNNRLKEKYEQVSFFEITGVNLICELHNQVLENDDVFNLVVEIILDSGSIYDYERKRNNKIDSAIRSACGNILNLLEV